MSKIGLTHPVLFAIWGIVTCCALFYCIIIGFSETKFKFQYFLLAIALVGMVLTISCEFDYDLKVQYWLHCIGSMTFSIVSGITVFLLFICKKDYTLSIISAFIMVTDLILLIIFKETAFIELMPIFAAYILLYAHNFKKEKKVIEIK